VNLLDNITESLAPYGFNLIGTATTPAYEALVPSQYHVNSLLPQAKTLVVIGNGGGDFWSGFRAHCESHPDYLDERAHPLDDYTSATIETALTPRLQAANVAYRYLYPFRFWTEPVSFMHLARAAGIAGPSILGVVIHPRYGPWMALRAAVLLDQEVSMPPQAPGFDPCPTCRERACMTACPTGAVAPTTGWNIPACVQHRLRIETDCVAYCRARYDCVYGREHRYPLDELQYHQRRSFAEMRKHFEKVSVISSQLSEKK
jgi:epoxyqueuosine reductase QueG